MEARSSFPAEGPPHVAERRIMEARSSFPAEGPPHVAERRIMEARSSFPAEGPPHVAERRIMESSAARSVLPGRARVRVGLPGQAEHPFTDHVAVHLGGPALDAVGPAPE